MRLSRVARSSIRATVRAELLQGIRRKTFCRHWSLVRFTCDLHGCDCEHPGDCADYDDPALRLAGRAVKAGSW